MASSGHGGARCAPCAKLIAGRQSLKLFLFILITSLVVAGAVSARAGQAGPTAGDPDLQAGFPVVSYQTAGFYLNGPALHALVANLDGDPQLEFAATATANGPLYVWNSDSSLLTGWPDLTIPGAMYPAAGNLVGNANTLELVSRSELSWLAAYDSHGELLPGWPIAGLNLADGPPALADVDGDGYDEIFIGDNMRNLYAFKADGSLLPGWPVSDLNSQPVHTPAIADLDQDGDLEITYLAGSINGYTGMIAYHHTGQIAAGPIEIVGIGENTYPAVGDVDGDHSPEIILARTDSKLLIYSADFSLERSAPLTGQVVYQATPALADLDGDHIPEILIATNGALHVFRGNGTAYPGWPRIFDGGPFNAYDTAPAIGDLDGDQLPEIAIILYLAGSPLDSELLVYHRDGTLDPRFPKLLRCGQANAPAIADIDLDGRNELIASGTWWDGYEGFFDKLWVYDLGGPRHGGIEWGQFMGGAHHRGVYPAPLPPSPPETINPEHPVYLPQINRSPAILAATISGRVTDQDVAAPGLPLELRFYDGASWQTVQNTLSDGNGGYTFRGAAPLAAGQAYSVRYQNPSGDAGRLAAWRSRAVYQFRGDGPLGVSEFNVADLPLVSPSSGVTLPIPVTFTWTPRSTYLPDMYSLVVYDPLDGDPAYNFLPVWESDGVTLNYLPSKLVAGTQYAWTIWLRSPDGSVGPVSETRRITFLASSPNRPADPAVAATELNWADYSDLPCNLYPFLDRCRP